MEALQKKLDQAIAVRESGNLVESKQLFEALFESTKKDDVLYPTILAEYVIQARLEGKERLTVALELAQGVHRQFPNTWQGLRSIAHTLIDLEYYEQAEPYLRQMVGINGNNSLKNGEVVAHLCMVLFRMGKPVEADGLIDQAIADIRSNSKGELYVAIRESYALRVKALIKNALGKVDEAQHLAREALMVAKKGKAIFRIREAQVLLSVLG